VNPAPIDTLIWSEIGSLLTSLWIVVLLIVIFATNMLIGHNLIPSLVASEDIPRISQKARPVFYALAIMSFGLAMYFLSRVVELAGVLRLFYADYWI
jgi:hypothetical protein